MFANYIQIVKICPFPLLGCADCAVSPYIERYVFGDLLQGAGSDEYSLIKLVF